jgi:hypothetical protein
VDFGVDGGLAWALGVGAEPVVGSRFIQTLSLHGFPHLGFSLSIPSLRYPVQINPGLLLEYMEVRQIADSAGAGYSFRGNGYLLGAGVSFRFGVFSALLGYHLYGSYAAVSPIKDSSDITYAQGRGLLIEIGYDIFPRFTAELRFRSTDFHRSVYTFNNSDIDADLSPALSQNTLGIGGRLSF